MSYGDANERNALTDGVRILWTQYIFLQLKVRLNHQPYG